MKYLTTLLILLFVSFASAQENKSELHNETTSSDVNTVSLNAEHDVVISVKGIKTMEEIDIENYNKSTYIKLIAKKKKKVIIC